MNITAMQIGDMVDREKEIYLFGKEEARKALCEKIERLQSDMLTAGSLPEQYVDGYLEALEHVLQEEEK